MYFNSYRERQHCHVTSPISVNWPSQACFGDLLFGHYELKYVLVPYVRRFVAFVGDGLISIFMKWRHIIGRRVLAAKLAPDEAVSQ